MIKRYALLGLGLVVIAAVLHAFDTSTGSGGLKQLFIPIAIVYLDVFKSSSTAIFLCLAMGMTAVFLLLYYWFGKFGPTVRNLRVLAADIEHVRAEPSSTAAVEEIDRAVKAGPTLQRAWELYRSSLVAETDGRVTARVPPENYLTVRALQAEGLKMRFFMGLPNDFVGIGLIFTFLGLVAGLYFATQSMMSADLSAAREGLVLLLHSATFKFLTSVTGIFLSIVFSAFQRYFLDRLQDGLQEVHYQLERKLPLNAALRFEAVPTAAE